MAGAVIAFNFPKDDRRVQDRLTVDGAHEGACRRWIAQRRPGWANATRGRQRDPCLVRRFNRNLFTEIMTTRRTTYAIPIQDFDFPDSRSKCGDRQVLTTARATTSLAIQKQPGFVPGKSGL